MYVHVVHVRVSVYVCVSLCICLCVLVSPMTINLYSQRKRDRENTSLITSSHTVLELTEASYKALTQVYTAGFVFVFSFIIQLQLSSPG